MRVNVSSGEENTNAVDNSAIRTHPTELSTKPSVEYSLTIVAEFGARLNDQGQKRPALYTTPITRGAVLSTLIEQVL